MSESKQAQHTPGPWRAVGTDVFAPSKRVAQCDDRLDIHFRGEALANARLFAAAPDLLEAAELAEATIERLQGGARAFSSANGTLDVLRAAIARAKGEQSS